MLETPIAKELDLYRQLQKSFSCSGFLVHFNCNRVLYTDIDASKKGGFGAMIYHLKEGANPGKPRRIDVEPILFPNWLLNSTETRYYSIELELAGVV